MSRFSDVSPRHRDRPGLAARAPYFCNGSAKDLRELVDYYDRRFDMRLTSQDKEDLINFLGVL